MANLASGNATKNTTEVLALLLAYFQEVLQKTTKLYKNNERNN